MLEHEMARVEPLLSRYGYLAVFAAVFVEGFGIPAPGQTLLLAGAVLAARGEMSLPTLLLTSATASTAGTLVGWAIGRFGGRRLIARLAGSRLSRVEDLFRRYGAGLVLLGRFVDGVRQLAGISAGALGMAPAAFLVWNAAGAALWTAFWGLGAWAFTRDFHAIAGALHHARAWLWAISGAAAVGILAWIAAGRARGPGGRREGSSKNPPTR